MKTEFTDVSETQKTVTIEIPSDVVDAEINRIAQRLHEAGEDSGLPSGQGAGVGRQAALQGSDPPRRDARAHPARDRGSAPGARHRARGYAEHQGRRAQGRSAAEVHGGDRDGAAVRSWRHVGHLAQAGRGEHRRCGRGRDAGAASRPRGQASSRSKAGPSPTATPWCCTSTARDRARIPITTTTSPCNWGPPATRPDFDANLVGLNQGESKTFTIHFPEDYGAEEFRNADVEYAVTIKDIRRRVLPDLDDEFAKDLGEFESLAGLRDRVRADMTAEAEEHAKRHTRTELLKQLAQRVSFEVPASLVDREMDRRLEEFARQLMQQNIDPQTGRARLGAIPGSPAGAGAGGGRQRTGARRDCPAGKHYCSTGRCR